MSVEKTSAIILRLVPWSETSVIATLLTREFGKIGVLAKGARRLKSPFEGSLDLLSVCSVVFIDKAGDVLDILTESKLLRRFRSAERDLAALNAGYYMADLVSMAIEADPHSAEVFELVDRSLLDLDSGLVPAAVLLRFEWRLLEMLGHKPQLRSCASCGRALLTDGIGAGASPYRVAFAVPSASVICDACLPGHRDIQRLKVDTILFLDRLPTLNCCSVDADALTTQRLTEARRITNRIWTQVLERPPRLAEMISRLEFSTQSGST